MTPILCVIVSKENDIPVWLDTTSHATCTEQLNYSGDAYDAWLNEKFDIFWREYCQKHAVLYTDDYAVLACDKGAL